MCSLVTGVQSCALPIFIIATLAVVGNVIACSLVAYAFARLNFAFKRTPFAMMLLTIMLPLHATLIPQSVLFFHLGWAHTILPIGKASCRGRVWHDVYISGVSASLKK